MKIHYRYSLHFLFIFFIVCVVCVGCSNKSVEGLRNIETLQIKKRLNELSKEMDNLLGSNENNLITIKMSDNGKIDSIKSFERLILDNNSNTIYIELDVQDKVEDSDIKYLSVDLKKQLENKIEESEKLKRLLHNKNKTNH